MNKGKESRRKREPKTHHVAEDTGDECVMPKGERAMLVAQIKQELDYTANLGTVYYPPSVALPTKFPDLSPGDTTYWFDVSDTIDWVIENYGSLTKPLVLNFASAKKRGGGFESGHGVLAQEECLCMSTDLYASLKDPAAADYYTSNKSDPRNGLYHHTIIYTATAHILRTGSLCKKPFHPLSDPLPISIITCPAVNYGVYLDTRDANPELALNEMRERLARVFQVALMNGHRDIIMGPWGCGVFKGKIKDLMTNIKLCPYTQYFNNLYFLSPQEKTVLEMQYSA